MASSSEYALNFGYMERWLKASGAAGLERVELADFPTVGRGLRALQRFKAGEKILTIPHSALWTVENAYSDLLLGPALCSVQPPLSVDDTLAIFILFIRSQKSGYDGPRSHVSALPTSYSSSIFFTEEELEVCAGTSLYTVTKQLGRQIENDYQELCERLIGLNGDLFPPGNFTVEDVSIVHA
jgi:hypothetical protein